MENNRNEIIEKIRKIMALAENNPNENEAFSAALKAQKLMAQYHIKEKDLGQEVNERNVNNLACVVSGKVQKWRISLAMVLAKNFRCKVYLLNNDVVFMGFEEDTEICKEVFYSMFKIGNKLADKKKREMRSKYGTAKDVKNTFCMGFVNGIKNELEKQCTALMIVVPKEVNEEFNKKFANTKKKSMSMRIDVNSGIYNEGFIKGKEAIRSKSIEAAY